MAGMVTNLAMLWGGPISRSADMKKEGELAEGRRRGRGSSEAREQERQGEQRLDEQEGGAGNTLMH